MMSAIITCTQARLHILDGWMEEVGLLHKYKLVRCAVAISPRPQFRLTNRQLLIILSPIKNEIREKFQIESCKVSKWKNSALFENSKHASLQLIGWLVFCPPGK